MKYELGTIKVQAEIREESSEKIESFSDVTQKYSDLGNRQKEHFYAVFLNNGNEVIGDKLIGLGNNDSAPIDIQDILRTATLVNAAAAILIHNHPSGIAEATDQDKETTKKIQEALDQIGVHLLDHVIITHHENYSMKQHTDIQFTD